MKSLDLRGNFFPTELQPTHKIENHKKPLLFNYSVSSTFARPGFLYYSGDYKENSTDELLIPSRQDPKVVETVPVEFSIGTRFDGRKVVVRTENEKYHHSETNANCSLRSKSKTVRFLYEKTPNTCVHGLRMSKKKKSKENTTREKGRNRLLRGGTHFETAAYFDTARA